MAKGLDPAKITYEQVLEGIEKLTEWKKAAQAEYRPLSKDIRDKEQQLQMMEDYIDREGIKTSKKKSRSSSKENRQER